MQQIINHIKNSTGKDLGCYSNSFLRKTIDQRISETSTGDLPGYLTLISINNSEVEKLLKSFNISYSLFFRNPVDFSILERYIMPELFQRNLNAGKSVRTWSAACAEGQEPYSIAIIADDLAKNQFNGLQFIILATDISEHALVKARNGEFLANSVQNVKYSNISKYFTISGQIFRICERIKHSVEFEYYDLLDMNTTSPPIGIFGGFDIVICCNLLIYYNAGIQRNILKKLYNSITAGGILMVDESERSIVKSFDGFRLYSKFGNIFVKND